MTAISHKFEACPALQQTITAANDAFINMMLTAARNIKTDPLAAFLIGISAETMEEYAKISKADLISASALGAPLFVPRFSDAATLRTLLSSGFGKASVLAALTKTLPLPPVPTRRKTLVAS